MRRSQNDSIQQIHRLGERIAARLKISATDLRYASLIHHNGHQWTVTYRWERNVDGTWMEIEDCDWLDAPSTPSKQP